MNQFQQVSSGKDLETLGSVTFQQVGTITGTSKCRSHRSAICHKRQGPEEPWAASPSSR